MKPNFSATATSHIGRALMIHAVAHTITSLSDKMGKLKNGQDAPYLVVTAADGKTDMLHPRTAVTLFSKGEAAGIKLLVDAVVAEATPVAPAAPTKAEKPAKKAVKAASTKGDSTKAKHVMVRIFNDAIAKNAVKPGAVSRQDVIQGFMKESGCSLHCANTYYQNMRSGLWA